MRQDPAWLRLLIAGDTALQAGTEHGKLCITLSSRTGTGVAHQKPWAMRAQWFIERSIPVGWIFRRKHCAKAVLHDWERAMAAIYELTDPVVVAWVKSELPPDELGDYGTWRPE